MAKVILDLIGNTPLLEIRHLNPNPNVKIMVKLEYFNPGGSIKDRAALYMIEAAEKSGQLTHDKIVIEATSGNTGIGLALVCAVKGYKLRLAMSESVSVERQKILKARGAEILLTPGHQGTDGAIEEVYRLARENPDLYFVTDQFNNEANWQAHYYGTGPELWQQTKGKLAMLVATLGTSGTLMGLSRRLKKYNPDITIVGVEPYLGHKLQGLKNMKESYQPEIFDKNLLDKKLNIDDEVAFDMTRRLAKEEGLLVGMSSGAAMAVACEEAKNMDSGVIVVIFPDGGERYLSTPLFAIQEKVKLKLFNTLTHTKEIFKPLISGKASVYSCGPTVHAPINIGQGRRFVFSDLLCRYLDYRGFSVQHIMNITDLDDKTILGSERQGLELSEFTRRYIDIFKKDLASLNIKPADKYPRASEHIEEMVLLTERLVHKGFAYEKLKSIYFNISCYKEYGHLSGVNLQKIRLGATVDLDEYEKDNPRDFTLLKRSRLSELKRGIFTKTKWGNVRPSWHLQCAAMSTKYLGETFDIHTAGRELMFPHHENEIAITGALSGKSLARYWVHCDRVLVDGKKVDEKGGALTIRSLLDHGWSGRVIRYWLLSNHYRKTLQYSKERLIEAQRALRRLDACIQALFEIRSGRVYPELDQLLYDIRNDFIDAMDDDLNISEALASIFHNIKRINKLIADNELDPKGAKQCLSAFEKINSVLNIFDFKQAKYNLDIQELLRKREKARQEKKWELADELRQRLLDQGVMVRDSAIISSTFK
jgi:cysteinyl-tRNA synthetase